MWKFCAVALMTLAIAGCGAGTKQIETVEVKVPVLTKATPSPELMADYEPDALPEFVAPDHPDATSALTSEGERRLKGLLLDLTGRIRAWQAWAAAPPPPDE